MPKVYIELDYEVVVQAIKAKVPFAIEDILRRLCRTNTRIPIKDKRMNDLIFTLFTEAHNELCERFKNKIE